MGHRVEAHVKGFERWVGAELVEFAESADDIVVKVEARELAKRAEAVKRDQNHLLPMQRPPGTAQQWLALQARASSSEEL